MGNEPLNNLSVRKSNDLISAKYRSTLLENQIMAIALTRIEINAKDKDMPLEAKLYPGELKRLVSDPAHISRDLKKISKSIIGHTMLLEDGKGNFKAFSVVPNAEYMDGVFTIKFNNELRDHVLGLESRYTSLELSVMTNFNKNASFRLYEILKKEAYRIKDNTKGVQVIYDLYELRFMIGLANSDDEYVKKAMGEMGSNVDWKQLFFKLDKKDRKHEEWRDFNRRVIKVAQEELKEKSDIRFEYEGIKEKGFTVYKNTPSNTEIIDERQRIIEKNAKANRQLEMPYDTFPEIYMEYVGHNNLAKEDIDLLLKKANYDTEVLKKAIQMADDQPHIDNYVGWLIRAIELKYDRTEVIEGSEQKAKEIRAIRKDYNDNRDTTAEIVWTKAKQKEEFPAFEEALGVHGVTIEQLEELFEASERTEIYFRWKKTDSINLEELA